jgi:adenosine deaminase
MPKGGDLHNHLSGAIYAESMIRWASEDGLCVDKQTFSLTPPPCDTAHSPVSAAQHDPQLYRQMIDAWSMHNLAGSGQSGHDHFFDTFDKFDLAGHHRTGDMLAEATSRAAAGRVSYLELMLTPAFPEIAKAASSAAGLTDFAQMHRTIEQNGLAEAVRVAALKLTGSETKRREIQHCDTAHPEPGCTVTVRYLYQVLRGLPADIVFAQMLLGFELASIDHRMVGLNLVMPEDAQIPMQDFSAHMRMLDYLHRYYPKVHITLHAGELTPGLVPPEGLRFHIRDSIAIGHAERIGHGVAVMQETGAPALLQKMARDKIMVEICLTSNDGILNIRGRQHPLITYLKQGVPVALATDDEGVSRSEMTQEYFKAVEEQHLNYRQLKAMAQNSLQYSFVEGAPLWLDFERRMAVRACSDDLQKFRQLGINSKPERACRLYLQQNPRAALQWNLEVALGEFERNH